MQFSCLTCSTRYNIADDKIREKTIKIRCKNCSETILIEWPLGASEARPISMVTTSQPAAATPPVMPEAIDDADLIAALRRASQLLQQKEYDQWRERLRRLIFHNSAWFVQ